MPKRAGSIRSDRGFTMLEILLVVAIMGILTVIALPQIDLYRIQANSAVQIMSTTMVAAQREALTKQHKDIHAVGLALDIFGAEHYDHGPSDAEDCNGTNNGRGCLNLTGGIIQKTRGAVGLTDGHGYTKRYAYNACAASDPPPYFPTTGRFARNRVYELDPRNFQRGCLVRGQPEQLMD